MILWSSAPDTGWPEPGRGGRSEFSCTGPRPPPETPRSTGRQRSRDPEPGDNNNTFESCCFSKVILFSQTLFDKCSLSKQCQLRNKSCFQYLICKNRNAIKSLVYDKSYPDTTEKVDQPTLWIFSILRKNFYNWLSQCWWMKLSLLTNYRDKAWINQSPASLMKQTLIRILLDWQCCSALLSGWCQTVNTKFALLTSR